MADIDIQRKHRGLWVALAALAAAALIVWLIVESFDGAEDARAEEPVATVPPAPAAPPAAVLVVDPSVPVPAVAAYLDHVRDTAAARGRPSHVYMAEGITRLGTALRELVQAQRGLRPEASAMANELYARAAALVVSPDTLRRHADWMSQAAVQAAEVLEEVASEVQGPVPALRDQVAQVRAAAAEIQPEEDLLAQEEKVRAFFLEAGDALAMLVTTPRP